MPKGDTVVPIMCATYGTHLTNYSGDMKAWSVYITIDNIKEVICNKTSNSVTLLLAYLPVTPNFVTETVQSESQCHQSQQAFHQTLNDILHSLLSSSEDGSIIDCPDGHQRFCFPILWGWIAKQEEHSSVQDIQIQGCPKCAVSRDDLGNLCEYPSRYHYVY